MLLIFGWLMHGVWGGIAAGVLFVMPSLFILSGLTWVYLAYGDLPAIEGILYGIKPAVTAIVVFAAYRIGSRALHNNVLRGMAVLAFIAIFALKIPFPYIVLDGRHYRFCRFTDCTRKIQGRWSPR